MLKFSWNCKIYIYSIDGYNTNICYLIISHSVLTMHFIHTNLKQFSISHVYCLELLRSAVGLY